VEKSQKAEEIWQRLNHHYGQPLWEPGRDPVDELILTILSANTNDVNSGRAFAQLRATFNHDWDAIRCAPLDEIKQAIRPAGMYHQKAPHIVATLEKLHRARGSYNLDYPSPLP
jgi:endonuclease III